MHSTYCRIIYNIYISGWRNSGGWPFIPDRHPCEYFIEFCFGRMARLSWNPHHHPHQIREPPIYTSRWMVPWTSQPARRRAAVWIPSPALCYPRTLCIVIMREYIYGSGAKTIIQLPWPRTNVITIYNTFHLLLGKGWTCVRRGQHQDLNLDAANTPLCLGMYVGRSVGRNE